MTIVYCVGCKRKYDSEEYQLTLAFENKTTVKGVKRFLKTTCPRGHKVANIVKRGETQ